MAHLKQSPIASEIDPAPRIIRLVSVAIQHAGRDCGEDVQRFAETIAKRLVRTARILEGENVVRRVRGKRQFWEDLAFKERRVKIRKYNSLVREFGQDAMQRAPRDHVPMSAMEKAQLAEFDARAAATAGSA